VGAKPLDGATQPIRDVDLRRPAQIAGRDGVIVAPPKDNQILPGITYDAAFELAREGGLPIEVRPVPKDEALAADEMWLSSSTKEVLAVTALDGRPFGGGKPGPVFKKLYALFQASKAADAMRHAVAAS